MTLQQLIQELSQQTGRLETSTLVMIGCVALAFVVAWVVNRISILRIRRRIERTDEIRDIMQHTLDLNNCYVLKLDLRTRLGKNMHGHLLPPEGMAHQKSFEYIHPDDQLFYKDFIQQLYYGKTYIGDCIFRWDISGDKHLGQWRYMHDRGVAEYIDEKSKRPTSLFCTLTDETDLILKERQDRALADKYRMMFEQTIVGLAFYDKDGRLLTTNQKMREILKFQSEYDPYYYSKSLYDLPTFRDVLNNRHVEELFFCAKSVAIERGVNCHTELRVHPIYDNDKLVFIAFSIRDITQERQLYLQSKENEAGLRRANEDVQRYERELRYLMENCNMRFFRIDFAQRLCTFYKSLNEPISTMGFDKLMWHFVDSPFKEGLLTPERFFSQPRVDLSYMHPFFHEGEELQWNFVDTVPEYDDSGQLVGTYGLVRNVNELIKKQELLKQETQRANDSGRMKSMFMANMTHEIRTPLNSIVGFSDLLSMIDSPEEKREIVHVIMNNCDMLLRLVNDILEVSTMNSDTIKLEPENVDFAKAFDTICASLEKRVELSSVTFLKDSPCDSLPVCVDIKRMQQVLTNFVTNAVKYTKEGHIKVGYRYENGGIYMYCEDTGVGIPKDKQAMVFERFVKLNEYVQGTGLGLSICKAIAKRAGGKIGLSSEGEGKGSTFWIWIPCQMNE